MAGTFDRSTTGGVGPVIRLLIVDDHLSVRWGLEQMFAMVAGIEVVGSAADGAQAIALADQLVPDVILMDIAMPRVDGVEATRLITVAQPTSRIVILSGQSDQARIRDALQAGAVSYLPKESDPEDVIRAVRAAYNEVGLSGTAG